jgi:hypothetical protein
VYQVESTLIKRFRELREQGLKPDFSMILASVSPQGRASMYVFDSNSLAEPVHDNPGFALIGTGFVTGGNLLLRLLGYSAEESWLFELGLLSAFIIDVVSEVDPAVGPFIGESYLMRIENGARARAVGRARPTTKKPIPQRRRGRNKDTRRGRSSGNQPAERVRASSLHQDLPVRRIRPKADTRRKG